MKKEISIHLLTIEELGAEKESYSFPADYHKYMLFETEEKILLFLSPIHVDMNGERCEILHKYVHQIAEYRRFLPQDYRILGGGTIGYGEGFVTKKKMLTIGGSSASYPRPKQEVLNEIKDEVSTFYQNEFPELQIEVVEVHGMTKEQQW